MPESRPGEKAELRLDRGASRGWSGGLGAKTSRDNRVPAIFHFGGQHPDDRGASGLEAKRPKRR